MSRRAFVLPILAGVLLLPVACSKPAPPAAPISSTPVPVVAAADLPDIRARAKASSDCSQEFYRSVNFKPPQQKAIFDRGKYGELAADANSIDQDGVQTYLQALQAHDDWKRAEAYIITLQDGGMRSYLSPEKQARSMVLDAYYEAMGAPADCAVPADLLNYIGKSAS